MVKALHGYEPFFWQPSFIPTKLGGFHIQHI